MRLGIDEDWYWLRQIYFLLKQVLGHNALVDWVAPIASIAIAAAAFFVAFMSWRTARHANKLNDDHWQADRRANELRQRRSLAVDMREWFSDKWFNARWEQADDSQLLDDYSRLIRKCDKLGEDTGKRLVRYLQRISFDERNRFKALPPKEKAMERHPSRSHLSRETQEDLIRKWVDHPDAITSTLDADDFAREAERNREFASLLRP